MNITIPCVVELTWTLKDTLGTLLDELQEGVEFFIGGHDLLAKIEEALIGLAPGASLDLHLEPEDAFGDYDEHLVFLESRELFPAEIEEGQCLEASALPKNGLAKVPEGHLYTITEIYPEHVVLDGNHPLAGIALRLHLVVLGVREANDAELKASSMGVGFFYSPELGKNQGQIHNHSQPSEGHEHPQNESIDLAQINPALASLDAIFDFEDEDIEGVEDGEDREGGGKNPTPTDPAHNGRLH